MFLSFRVVLLFVGFCFGQDLSWSDVEKMIVNPPRFSLVDKATFGCLSSCNASTLFDDTKPITWMFGADTVAQFAPKDGVFMLRSVGLSEELIKTLVMQNDTCLIMFHLPSNTSVFKSTWSNMRLFVDSFCPICASKITDVHIHELNEKTFEEIMGQHASGIDSNYRDPELDAEALSWTVEKMEQAESVDVFAVRSFLYNVLDCSFLFLGDGTSFNANYGARANDEFVARKIDRSELSVFKSIKLNL